MRQIPDVSRTQEEMTYTHAADIGQLLITGATPRGDGWAWLYDAFAKVAPRGSRVRTLVCAYFRPARWEMVASSAVYRWAGVAAFGRFIPTGGIGIRRLTGAEMRPYTFHRGSLAGTRDFYYRACVFEALHMPFFLALIGLAVQRYTVGRVDYAAQEPLINLLVNLLPMLHHRHTRARILRLLSRKATVSKVVAAG